MAAQQLTCDVLVVGAGPAGSAMATRLATAGRRVMLVEARRHPRAKTCAEYASPRIADELALLGVPAATWHAHAQPLSGMDVIRGRDRVAIRYADRHGPRPSWGLDRLEFDALLARHAAASGAELIEEAAFETLRWSDGRVAGAVVRTREGKVEISTDWVIGADGARSRVASQAGVRRPVRVPRRIGLVAHYEGLPALLDHGEMHVGRGYYVGLAPLPGGRLNVGMALPIDGRSSAQARFEAAIAGIPAVARRLRGRAAVTRIRGASPIGARVARAAGPGWMLIGDAAGFIDPFTGEGIYRALRSARAAGDAIGAGARARPERRYLELRRSAFAGKDALTWLIQGLLAGGPVLGYALRRLAARPDAARVLGAALGDCRPARDALTARFLVEVLRP